MSRARVCSPSFLTPRTVEEFRSHQDFLRKKVRLLPDLPFYAFLVFSSSPLLSPVAMQ